MDDDRFDGWTGVLGSLIDRRATARTLAAGAPAGFGLAAGPDADVRKKKKKRPSPPPGCQFTKTPTLWTLQADCTTSTAIGIPSGVTLDGNGKTIKLVSAVTAANAAQLQAGTDVAVRDVTLDGSGLSGSCASFETYSAILIGSGEVERVTIDIPCGTGITVVGGPVNITDSSIATADGGVLAGPGTFTADGNTITIASTLFGTAKFGLAVIGVGPGAASLVATNNTIVGPGATAARAAGVSFADSATGEVSGNTISNFFDSLAGTTSCGILLDAAAGAVTLGTNTFPTPPGNEQDVCDNRP